MPRVPLGKTSSVTALSLGLPSTSRTVARVPVPPPAPPDEPVFVIVTVWPDTPSAMPEPAATLTSSNSALEPFEVSLWTPWWTWSAWAFDDEAPGALAEPTLLEFEPKDEAPPDGADQARPV